MTVAEGITTAPAERADIASFVTATGSLMPERSQALTFGIGGRVDEVLVTESQQIEEGQVLARLDTTDFDLSLKQAQASLAVSEANLARASKAATASELASAEAAVLAAEAALARMNQGPSDLDLQLAELSIAQAKNTLYGAQGNRDALAGNPAAGGGSQASAEAQVLNAEVGVTVAELNREKLLRPPDASTIRNAESQLAQAQANLARIKALPSPEDIRVAEAQVRQAQVSVAQAENRLQDTLVTAPFSGQVAALNLHVNDVVSPNTSVGTLVDVSRFHLDVAIDETEIADVSVGQIARLTLDAFPDAPIQGTVSRIDLLGSSTQGIAKYTVTIALEPSELEMELRPLMTAAIDILVEMRADVVVIPNRALRRDPDGMYVETVRAGALVRVGVEMGISNDDNTEILSGLEPGEQVVISRPREGLLALSPFGG
ncbi:MAG TPA: efflux RND transporter periplasmic adaptor subunit [Anaerolineae bacterium]|nr:efflux RND transporter periplasmic adaptor subunit [Anaerolineae bacterium]